MTKPNCLEDNFFVWTKDLNNQLRDLPTANKVITIILGLCMDSLALTCFYKWITDLNRSWTFPLALCSVYALKILIHVLPLLFYFYLVHFLHGCPIRHTLAIPRNVLFNDPTLRTLK